MTGWCSSPTAWSNATLSASTSPHAIAETRALHPREAVRALADRVLQATGNKLNDDATVLCLDWHGGHGRDRDSHHGAEQRRASAPLA